MKTVGAKLSESLIKRIDNDCKKQVKKRSELIRNIIEDYYQKDRLKTIKEINDRVTTFLPDLRAQQQEMKQLKESLDAIYIQSQETQEYISKMKKGEYYYSQHTTKQVQGLIKNLYTALGIKTDKKDNFDVVDFVKQQIED